MGGKGGGEGEFAVEVLGMVAKGGADGGVPEGKEGGEVEALLFVRGEPLLGDLEFGLVLQRGEGGGVGEVEDLKEAVVGSADGGGGEALAGGGTGGVKVLDGEPGGGSGVRGGFGGVTEGAGGGFGGQPGGGGMRVGGWVFPGGYGHGQGDGGDGFGWALRRDRGGGGGLGRGTFGVEEPAQVGGQGIGGQGDGALAGGVVEGQVEGEDDPFGVGFGLGEGEGEGEFEALAEGFSGGIQVADQEEGIAGTGDGHIEQSEFLSEGSQVFLALGAVMQEAVVASGAHGIHHLGGGTPAAGEEDGLAEVGIMKAGTQTGDDDDGEFEAFAFVDGTKLDGVGLAGGEGFDLALGGLLFVEETEESIEPLALEGIVAAGEVEESADVGDAVGSVGEGEEEGFVVGLGEHGFQDAGEGGHAGEATPAGEAGEKVPAAAADGVGGLGGGLEVVPGEMGTWVGMAFGSDGDEVFQGPTDEGGAEDGEEGDILAGVVEEAEEGAEVGGFEGVEEVALFDGEGNLAFGEFAEERFGASGDRAEEEADIGPLEGSEGGGSGIPDLMGAVVEFAEAGGGEVGLAFDIEQIVPVVGIGGLGGIGGRGGGFGVIRVGDGNGFGVGVGIRGRDDEVEFDAAGGIGPGAGGGWIGGWLEGERGTKVGQGEGEAVFGIVADLAQAGGEEGGEEVVGEGDQAGAAAEIFGERQDLVMGEGSPLGGVVAEAFRGGHAEPVDALFDVSDHEQVGLIAVAGEGAEEGILGGVDILAFVNEHLFEAGTPGEGDGGGEAIGREEQAEGELFEIGEVDAALGAFGFGIGQGEALGEVEHLAYGPTAEGPFGIEGISLGTGEPGAQGQGVIEEWSET